MECVIKSSWRHIKGFNFQAQALLDSNKPLIIKGFSSHFHLFFWDLSHDEYGGRKRNKMITLYSVINYVSYLVTLILMIAAIHYLSTELITTPMAVPSGILLVSFRFIKVRTPC